MDSNKIIIHPTGDEITFRQGAAKELLKPTPPNRFDIEGNIETPAIWVEEKSESIDKLHAYAMIHKDELSIILHLNKSQENGRLHSTVTGKLALSQRLLAFHINDGHKWSLRQLADHIKFNRRYFADHGLNAKMVTELKNFTATLNATLEKKSDDRGTRRNLIDRTFNSNVPERFTLTMPIIEGCQDETFEVELLIDGSEEGTKVWLQSIELDEIMTNTVNRIFKEQIESLEQSGITVISK